MISYSKIYTRTFRNYREFHLVMQFKGFIWLNVFSIVFVSPIENNLRVLSIPTATRKA